MTKEQLFRLIGSVDESMLDETVTAAPKRRWIPWAAAAAACLAVCVTAAYFAPKLQNSRTEPQLAVENTTEITTEAAPAIGIIVPGMQFRSSDNGTLGPLSVTFNEADHTYAFANMLDSSYPETGTYTQDGTTITATSQEGKISVFELDSDVLYENFDLQLLESESFPDFAGSMLTSKIAEDAPFADWTTEDIASVTTLAYDSWEYTLDGKETAQFMGLLQKIVLYQEVFLPEEEPKDTGASANFTITLKDGTVREIVIGQRFTMDGLDFLAEPAACGDLEDLAWELSEKARDLANSETEPTTETNCQGAALNATILSINSNYLTVKGLESNGINERGEFSFSADAALIHRGDTVLTAEDLQVGDLVLVTYTGDVLESDPAQLQGVVEIQLLSEE